MPKAKAKAAKAAKAKPKAAPSADATPNSAPPRWATTSEVQRSGHPGGSTLAYPTPQK